MLSHHYQLAQVNVARMRGPLDSPVMAEFVAQLPAVNALADHSPGFVWRLETSEGVATAVRACDDPLILFNLSVWESIEALQKFTYDNGHLGPLRDRANWFERPGQAHLALWWIPAGQAANTPNGDTRFHYRQSGARVWATYSGGPVRFGALAAAGDAEGRLDMRYHHVDPLGALRTGVCLATPQLLSDGRVRLSEEWQWTSGDSIERQIRSGRSTFLIERRNANEEGFNSSSGSSRGHCR